MRDSSLLNQTYSDTAVKMAHTAPDAQQPRKQRGHDYLQRFSKPDKSPTINPRHARSASLLGRLRGSPTASPTSSESSRDARSERTLAHSASSGSIRLAEPQRAVRVLPPDAKQSPRRQGFISQLLKGSRTRSQDQVFVRSPRTPRPQAPSTPNNPGEGDARSPQSFPAHSPAEYPMAFADVHMQCADHAQPPFCVQGMECTAEPGSSPEDPNTSHPEFNDLYYVHHNTDNSAHMLAQEAEEIANAGFAQSDEWYHPGSMAETSSQIAGRLVSSLPVYEPIDLSRVSPMQGYPRATRPVLPDARMLAPMASLAEVYGNGMSEYNMLSNRELRFAVENHMLVEQHRYLIRDLGHARSAIAALKQVVQAKEERIEQCEMANVEMQQRCLLLESVLSREQRQRLESLPYAFEATTSPLGAAQLPNDEDSALDQPTQGADYDSLLSVQRDEGKQKPEVLGVGLSLDGSAQGTNALAGNKAQPGDRSADGKQEGAEPRRINRPLSGYTTGFTFSDKPIQHLPRVFSGDYSATDVHAMETSVEALASVITSMPRDENSVEEIIASKMAEDERQIRREIQLAEQCAELENDRGRRNTEHSVDQAEGEPKRRSRFLSMLRLSAFNGSAPRETPMGDTKQKRRSVSLGNGKAKQDDARPTGVVKRSSSTATHDIKLAEQNRHRADSLESLAASCPTLIPGIAKTKHTARPQRQQSAESVTSAGRYYPSGLGLGTEGSSTANSRQSSANTSSLGDQSRDILLEGATAPKKKDAKRRMSHRLSFTSKPRRSTSAPSRPHSMRVARRKSWLHQLFGSNSQSSIDSSDAGSTITDDEMSDQASADEGGGRQASRRRRVLTHSTDEVSQFLGRLRLEEGSRTGGVLEDVIDVSGEDEERASRPSLSVAEIRQQTLDALNGTLRGAKRVSLSAASSSCADGELQPASDVRRSVSPAAADNSEKPVTPTGAAGADTGEPLDHSVSRWRQRETSGPTIRRLKTPQKAREADSPSKEPSGSASSGSLGLGVTVSQREQSSISFLPSIATSATSASAQDDGAGDKSPEAGAETPSSRRKQKPAAPVIALGESGLGSAGRKWAPAFWAPPSLNYQGAPLGSPIGASGNSWSPRGSTDSADRRPSFGARPSEELRYRSPQGSIGLAVGSSTSVNRGSPWELVKVAESRTFPLSPSRPGTPPSRPLAFFEDTTVPDSDELTAAARRSLSLRMSRNAFRQVEPLPESDADSAIPSDGEVVEARRLGHGKNGSQDGQVGLAETSLRLNHAVKNNALSRVVGSTQHKRRSLLWQFNAKNAGAPGKALGGQPTNDDKEPQCADALVAASGELLSSRADEEACAPGDASHADGGARKPKKWWSVLG
ncbi:hypothetical protein BX070DRAFT_27112 [Coemansia spiralis]|nr:hypothetical protein BX070DRAFT_27112 [Coemansia spiralis]